MDVNITRTTDGHNVTDMLIDITFSPVDEPHYRALRNVYCMMMGPKTITTRWKDGTERTRYEYVINSGIFTIEGKIISKEELPFIQERYYLVLVTKHKEEAK